MTATRPILALPRFAIRRAVAAGVSPSSARKWVAIASASSHSSASSICLFLDEDAPADVEAGLPG
jgi:hypothetical protein